MQIATVESYEVEQDDFNGASYDDEEQGTYDPSTDVEKADPPAEQTQDDLGEEDIDFDEEQSVEIPPTTVVQKMLMRESAPKEGGSRFILYAGIVACCLLIVVIVLSAGYGSGAFKDEKKSSRLDNADGGTTSGDTTNGGTTDGGTTSGGTTGGGTTGGSNVVPTMSPTDAPITPEQASRAAVMSEYLASVNVGGAESLTDGPERAALTWLTADDPLQLDPTVAVDQQRIRQRYALLQVYFNSASRWEDESGWLAIEDECAGWFGVTCDDSQVVTSINMEGNNVQGVLPADLSLLTGLVILNLASNIIGGELPAAIATLPALEELYLGGNLFVQDLSDYDFSGLQSLTLLELGDNGFSGTIPESLWTLTTLQFLIIDDNQFSGELSGSISQLTLLRKYIPCA